MSSLGIKKKLKKVTPPLPRQKKIDVPCRRVVSVTCDILERL